MADTTQQTNTTPGGNAPGSYDMVKPADFNHAPMTPAQQQAMLQLRQEAYSSATIDVQQGMQNLGTYFKDQFMPDAIDPSSALRAAKFEIQGGIPSKLSRAQKVKLLNLDEATWGSLDKTQQAIACNFIDDQGRLLNLSDEAKQQIKDFKDDKLLDVYQKLRDQIEQKQKVAKFAMLNPDLQKRPEFNKALADATGVTLESPQEEEQIPSFKADPWGAIKAYAGQFLGAQKGHLLALGSGAGLGLLIGLATDHPLAGLLIGAVAIAAYEGYEHFSAQHEPQVDPNAKRIQRANELVKQKEVEIAQAQQKQKEKDAAALAEKNKPQGIEGQVADPKKIEAVLPYLSHANTADIGNLAAPTFPAAGAATNQVVPGARPRTTNSVGH